MQVKGRCPGMQTGRGFSFQLSAGCESTIFSGIRPKGQHNAIKLFSVNRKPNRRVSIAEN
jgi:hypothetical protein